jgi:Tle cognate immunity protein 4 C-terminal domain/Tle cognate immunity protein 4 N-terminal domain
MLLQRMCWSFDTGWHTVRSILCLIVLALCSYWAYGRSAVYLYTPKNMITLSGKTQTQCAGRYLVDMPVEMGNLVVTVSEFYFGLTKDFKTVEVKVISGYTQTEFVAETNKRVNELKTTENEALKIPLLLAQEVWDTPHGKALMLRYLKNELYSFSQVNSELHMLIGNRHTVVTATSSEDDYHNVKSGRISHKFINPKPMEDRIKVIAQNIKGYTDASKAPEGFCMNGVVMNNKTMGYDIETASFKSRGDRKLLPHLSFEIDMAGQFEGKGENVIERANRAGAELRLMIAADGGQLFDLRKGERTINAMPGLEYAYALHAYGGTTFLMQAQNHLPKEQQSLQRPFFTMELTVGESGNNPSPLTEEQALKVWDGLLGTMRLSPANGGQRVDAQTGGLVPTVKVGQTCPKTGWWEPSLPNTHPSFAYLGRDPQRFKMVTAGQPMPHVYAKFMFPDTADADNVAITWTLVKEA